MIRIVILLIFSINVGLFYGQDKEPVDTICSGSDTLILFSDKSWEFLNVLAYESNASILLGELHQFNEPYSWDYPWDNNEAYCYKNDLSTMEDTIWLCTTDSTHNNFALPHPGMVTSAFKYRGSKFHFGVDVDLVIGDTLVAAFDGIVRYAGYHKSGYGNLVVIRHYNGLETYYAHLKKIGVFANQEIKAGEVIGLGGKSGKATGDHLHFEIRFFGNALDPELVFDFKNNTLKDCNLFIHRDLFNYRSISSNKKFKANNGTSLPLKYHKIEKGDSLYGIALKYGVSVEELCKINKIKPSKTLHIGEVIQLK